MEQPAIILLKDGTKTIVIIEGGMALPLSHAILIDGEGNVINGLNAKDIIQCKLDFKSEEFLDFILEFKNIETNK